MPLYKNGVLVGALGISGDGVEQDDFVSAQAAIGFEPPDAIKADHIVLFGVQLPYLKFPRNPTFKGSYLSAAFTRFIAAANFGAL